MQVHPSVNIPSSISLWPVGRAPFASDEDAGLPRLTYYLPSDEFRTGQSVLVIPGGGYRLVSSAKEGHRPAQLLASHGIAAAVLEYRHAPSRHPVPLIDAQRALRRLRGLAGEHGLRTDQVGVLGFSAGGHLAGCLATQPAHEAGLAGDELDAVDERPDFAALVYPVATLSGPHAHRGSVENLLGDAPDPELVRSLSLEKAVTQRTPPMFLVHWQGDASVTPANSLELYAALTARGVPATLHLYEGGGHGAGLAANHAWGRELLAWLAARL